MKTLPTALRRRLWRERRRMAFCAAMLFASVYLHLIQHGAGPFGLPVPVVAGAVYVAVAVPALLVVCLVVPAWRFSCEIVAATLLVLAIWGAFDSRVGLDFAMRAKPPSIWILLVSWMVLTQLYCTGLLDRIRWRRPRFRYRLRSRLSAQELWDGMVGTPGRSVPQVLGGDLLVFEPLEDGAPGRRLVVRMPQGATVEEHHVVEVETPPRHIRYRWRLIHAAPGQPYATGLAEVAVRETGRGRVIEMLRQPDTIPLRLALQVWLDDGLGRLGDQSLAALERPGRPDPGASEAIAQGA